MRLGSRLRLEEIVEEDWEMSSRYLCSILDEMRDCWKTRNFSPLNGLIEEAQSRANRMENALSDKRDVERWEARRPVLKDELKELKWQKEDLEEEIRKLEFKKKEIERFIEKNSTKGTTKLGAQ